MKDQFNIEIVVYRDEKKEEFYSRLKITLDADTIEQAIVMAVDLLETQHMCQYYIVKKVRNNSVI